MQLPNESLEYHYTSLMAGRADEWTPAAEMRTEHFLSQHQLRDLQPRLMQARSQVVAERELLQGGGTEQPSIEGGFIDLPQKTLDEFRRKDDASLLGKVLILATRIREDVDRVVFVGSTPYSLTVRSLFQSLCHAYHNELPPEDRPGMPKLYLAGSDHDNDACQDLIQLLQRTCVDPELRNERWAMVVASRKGECLETATAYRVLRHEMAQYYGSKSDRIRQLIVPITASTSKLRLQCKAQGIDENNILTLPEGVGKRFSAFTAVGLLPAAIMGLDVKALLMGAASVSKRFLEEPFERNAALQLAATSYLLSTAAKKSNRAIVVWSRKLEALGQWYSHFVRVSLNKSGFGASAASFVLPRDAAEASQQLIEGRRDSFVQQICVQSPTQMPTQIGMSDQNFDDLNTSARKTFPELTEASAAALKQMLSSAVRPAGELLMPTISVFTMGQLMQLVMIATVIEARLHGVNPYSQQSADHLRRLSKPAQRSANP